MSSSIRSKRSRGRATRVLQKPAGVFHPRVQLVGPEHFGIVSVDCAKARSKWMLADFFGKILVPPTVVEHNRPAFDAMLTQLRQAIRDHDLRDVLVAVERTGRYHRPVQRAFAAGGFETRIVHPFATKQLRQPANPGDKTDDTDLAAIQRAATIGFALRENEDNEEWCTLQLLIRHRRGLVEKAAALHCQIREHLDAALPGFAACFDDCWDSAGALHRFRQFTSSATIQEAGLDGLGRSLRDAGIRFQRRSLTPVLTWAAQAAPPDLAATLRHRLARALDDERARKRLEIQALERELAARLAGTP